MRRTILPYDGVTTKEKYLSNALAKVREISPLTADAIERALVIYNDPANGVKDKGAYQLAEVSDAKYFRLGQGCQYSQLVNWIDPKEAKETHHFVSENLLTYGAILRDNDVYFVLDPLNQAVNDFHEAVSKVRRTFQLEDGTSGTVPVQQFTGQAFSTGELDSRLIDQIALFDHPSKIKYKFAGNHDYILVLPKTCTSETKMKVEMHVVNIGSTVLSTNLETLENILRARYKIRPEEKTKIQLYETLSDLRYGKTFVLKNKSMKTRGRVRIQVDVCGMTAVSEYPVVTKDPLTDPWVNVLVFNSPI